jgi:signal transduction histidine kinase/ActR/RegA family two-component response regulator
MADELSERVLILAPVGRDGPTSADFLGKVGLTAKVCTSLEELPAELERGAAALFVAEEALIGRDAAALEAWVRQQPPWSDLPVVMLTSHREGTRVAVWRRELVARLGNVAMLERPVQAITLTTTLQAAVRARGRQYEMRSLLELRDRAAEELQRRIKEATGELREQMAHQARIEDALRQAQKMEAIGQLTGGVAHDFNNLLMVISAGLEMIERNKNDERFAFLVEGMRNATQRGAKLIRQLLSFARRQPLKPEPVDLGRELGGMRDLLDRSLGTHLHLVMEFPADLWPVEVDASELELVVLNLAFNARDAMPNGGTITVLGENLPGWQGPEGRSEAQRRDFVRLSVSDTGTGMTPEVRARVFEPFFTTKEIGKGSGLGLAQAYGFAEGSGGLVEIESEVGRGTKVAIMLPRCLTPVAAAKQQPGQDTRAPTTNAEGARDGETGHHILLVEDDEEVASLVTEMLCQLGHQVLRTASASGALSALANAGRIDLVFSDIMMAGEIDGLGLARELKRRRPHLPVLLTSGYAEATRLSIEADGFQVLAKPYRLEQLKAAITRALELRLPASMHGSESS